MKQRDIYYANLSPTKGQEQRGLRPVVIISGNSMNDHLGVCIACPISSKIKNYASCVQLKKNKSNGLKSDSEIITFQVRTISKQRLGKKIGKISKDELEKVLGGLLYVLKY
ncbi:MAG: type II toxin-antitoxin system PemK/MazF family toxin [Nitrospirae bacterium]|nr:type II toxin-antitoxin system PemK/MazF family toxin [Nitrospirota bacterium]